MRVGEEIALRDVTAEIAHGRIIYPVSHFSGYIVIWSRRFDGESRALTDHDARELDLETASRQVRIELAPTPSWHALQFPRE